MTDTVTIVGNVATDPHRSVTTSGIAVTNFRLASSQRRYDAATQRWVETGTNWYTIAAFRRLAEHAAVSLHAGDSVIVTGRLRLRTWEAGGKRGTSVDIDADAIGHDLRWGTTEYRRMRRTSESAQAADDVASAPGRAEEQAPSQDADAWGSSSAGMSTADTPF
ncbi:MAG: single-stranded DNA-binding protein [Actinomycetota bacterium]